MNEMSQEVTEELLALDEINNLMHGYPKEFAITLAWALREWISDRYADNKTAYDVFKELADGIR